jgi:hypothetical protein
MALDSFESDQPASDIDMAGQPEILMHEPPAAAPRPARRSLFQIVCLEDRPRAKPSGSL